MKGNNILTIFSSVVGLTAGIITPYMFLSGHYNINDILQNSDLKETKFFNLFKGISFPELIYSCLRGITTYVVLILSFFLLIITLIIDVVLLIFGLNFPLSGGLLDFSWDNVLVSWYWNYSSVGNRNMSLVIIVLGAIIINRMDRIKANREYEKNIR